MNKLTDITFTFKNELNLTVYQEKFKDCRPTINVIFEEMLECQKAVEVLKKREASQVVFWYMGPRGLSQQCANFYKNKFIKPLLESTKSDLNLFQKATFWLYDLSAWKGLNDRTQGVDDISPNVSLINQLGLKELRAFASKDFFDRLNRTGCPELLSFIQEIFQSRDFIFKASETKEKIGQSIGALFNEKLFPKGRKDEDATRWYSAFQYLELLELTSFIIQDKLKNDTKEINIAFVVPNDELKYYYDTSRKYDEKNSRTACLAEDINRLALLKFGTLLKGITVNLSVITFKYLKQGDRPYLADKTKILKEGEFIIKDKSDIK